MEEHRSLREAERKGRLARVQTSCLQAYVSLVWGFKFPAVQAVWR